MNTRFNPTTNGAFHIGHLYTLLVNEYMAHSTGGKLVIRFDNTSITTQKLHSQALEEIIKYQQGDLEWLDIDINETFMQSDMMPDVKDYLRTTKYNHLFQEEKYEFPYFVRAGPEWIPFPYDLMETVQRVVMDAYNDITHVIRGEEFSTEFSLYCHICQELNFPVPKFIFLPRLRGKFREISKTNGGYTIAEFRSDGYSPDELIKIVSNACLYNTNSGWDIHNLKSNPQVNI